MCVGGVGESWFRGEFRESGLARYEREDICEQREK